MQDTIDRLFGTNGYLHMMAGASSMRPADGGYTLVTDNFKSRPAPGGRSVIVLNQAVNSYASFGDPVGTMVSIMEAHPPFHRMLLLAASTEDMWDAVQKTLAKY